MKSTLFPKAVRESHESQIATTAINNKSQKHQQSADRYYNQSDFEEYLDEKDNQVTIMAMSDEVLGSERAKSRGG